MFMPAEGTGKTWGQKQQLGAQCEGGGDPVAAAVNQPWTALPCQGAGQWDTTVRESRMCKSTPPCVLNFVCLPSFFC